MAKIKGLYRLTLSNEEGDQVLTQWPHAHDIESAIKVEEDADLSGQEIVHHLENVAESGNYHSMCSQYQNLYDLFLKETSESVAERLLAGIVDMGGLID
jgi:hypothetical protein